MTRSTAAIMPATSPGAEDADQASALGVGLGDALGLQALPWLAILLL